MGKLRFTHEGRGVPEVSAEGWDPGNLKPEEVASPVTIGGSIALVVIGAILRFGVTWKPAHVDLEVIGVILMIAGVAGLIISIAFLAMRRRGRASADVYEERRYTEPPD
jgi:Domain of unknown function (DUF6458)